MRFNPSFKQNLLLVIFGLLVAILLIEVLFRIAGLILTATEIETYVRNKKDYRILCFGDSSTYGMGASDADKFSYPSQLQKILNEKVSYKKFEVINLGVPGINSSQVLNRFRKNLLEHNPDLVIVMVGINDSWNLEESNVLKFYNEGILKRLHLSIELLLNRLRTYQFLKLVYISNEFKNSKGESNNESFSERKLELPPFNDETKSKGFKFSLRYPMRAGSLSRALENNIIELKSIAEDNRVNIIFMKYHNLGWGRPEKIIYQTYNKLKVPIVDNEILFKEAEEIGLDIRGTDGWHPNDFGYLLIAKNIYNKMVSLGLVTGESIELFE